MKCKGIMNNKQRCISEARIKGYCIPHYVKFIYKKKEKINLQKWREEREKMKELN
jgi:hypothetical protein